MYQKTHFILQVIISFIVIFASDYIRENMLYNTYDFKFFLVFLGLYLAGTLIVALIMAILKKLFPTRFTPPGL